MIDPYKTLGIRRNASKKTIQRAFRRLVKKAHPDTGGDASDFMALHLAYKVLMDDARRAKYDADGTIENTAADNELNNAMELLCALFLQVMAQLLQAHADAATVDPIEVLTKTMAASRKQLIDTQNGFKTAVKFYRGVMERITSEGTENVLERAARIEADKFTAHIAGTEAELVKLDRAIALLKDFRYRKDAVQMLTSPWSFGPMRIVMTGV
jgi:hypothetical protein